MLANLRVLLGVVIDIILLRRGPEHIPTSSTLLVSSVVGFALVSAAMTLLAPVAGPAEPNWPAQILIFIVVMALWYHLGLRVAGKRERYLQTATAVFLVNTLFLPAIMPMAGALAPYLIKQDPAAPPPAALSIMFIGVTIWLLVVEVRIVRAAFEWSNMASIAFVVGLRITVQLVTLLILGAQPRPMP